MALALTEEHLALAESVRGWAGRAAPAEVIRAAVAAGDGGAARYRTELTAALAEQGLFGLHLPEDDGGQGFGLPELAVALEELGRALLPGAFLPTVLAARYWPAAGAGPHGLLTAGRRLADRCRLARHGPDRPFPAGRRPGHRRQSGPVLAGSMADLIIAGVSPDRGQTWVALDAADLDVTPAGSRRPDQAAGSVRADDPVPADRVLAGSTVPP